MTLKVLLVDFPSPYQSWLATRHRQYAAFLHPQDSIPQIAHNGVRAWESGHDTTRQDRRHNSDSARRLGGTPG